MKQNSIPLAQRYEAALKKHLLQGSRASLQPAVELGRQTVAGGLGTLDLARIHEQAVRALMSPGHSPGKETRMNNRADLFFTEVHAPVEAHHRANGQSKGPLSEVEKALAQRTKELADANRRLQQSVVQRKTMEAAYEKRRKLHGKCLEESLRLQKRLRQLTHRLLTAQEDERKNISRELQDEIAQTLLGINVRLLLLKQQARGNIAKLKNEIASTQRLVVRSAGFVRGVAEKLGTHETQAPSHDATLPGGTANAPEAGVAGKPEAGSSVGK